MAMCVSMDGQTTLTDPNPINAPPHQNTHSPCRRPALAMRQTLRAVLPGASSLLAAISSSSSSHNTQASFHLHSCSTSTSREETCPSTPIPAPPTVPCDDDYDRTELLAGLHFPTTTTGDGSSGGFQLIHTPATPTAAAINPARWVTVGRSKGQPGADVTRGVLRLWLRNDHPTEAFRAEVG